MTCATCIHRAEVADRESENVWRVILLCAHDIDHVHVTAPDLSCKEYEPDIDQMGRGDSGNWN